MFIFEILDGKLTQPSYGGTIPPHNNAMPYGQAQQQQQGPYTVTQHNNFTSHQPCLAPGRCIDGHPLCVEAKKIVLDMNLQGVLFFSIFRIFENYVLHATILYTQKFY